MGLFKEVYCAECGNKAGLVTKTKLSDGNYLCSECSLIIPECIYEYAVKNYSIEDYKYLKEWLRKSSEEYGTVFSKTHSYGALEIDSDHSLFKINKGLFGNKNAPVFRIADISDYDFSFTATKSEEGLFGVKVTGEVAFCVTMSDPTFYYEVILEKNDSAPAKKTFFGNKLSYGHPKRLQEFELEFSRLRIEYLVDTAEEKDKRNEIEQAKTLFMIDDLETVSIEDLEELKNKLMLSFSAEENEKKAEKINSAYEVLKANVAKEG